ncbi:MAG: twin-arginine translocation signal domain-containing protein [Chloroflexi bacterium]|nr:MAG: twin-arginine translocation signal domain-containing protein [Chloroflexota bacterium]
MTEITRREFLKLGAAGTAGMALVPLANPLGFDLAAAKKRALDLRIAGAKEVHSVCPYCAVGCGLIAYTRESGGTTQLLQIEGDPDSPINQRGRPRCSSQPPRGGSQRRCTARRAVPPGKRRAGTSCSTSLPRTSKRPATTRSSRRTRTATS